MAANTFFLVDWGAARMPWVFIGVGVFVSAFSYGISALRRRDHGARGARHRPRADRLHRARAARARDRARPAVSFALMVGYFLGFQMAFITLGLLAGRLFDIRQMKRFFPRCPPASTSGSRRSSRIGRRSPTA